MHTVISLNTGTKHTIMKPQDSKTYCPFPFISSSLQADNTVLPCGQFMKSAPFQKVIPLHEVREGEFMNNMRTSMLNSKQVDGCQCYAEEAVGIPSMREAGIKRFGYTTELTLRKIEFVADNVCNIKCRSCGSTNSHLWHEDEIKLYGKSLLGKKYVKNTLYKDVDLSHLEEIEVLGGEPIISPATEDFFRLLIEKDVLKNITIKLSTNGVELPKGTILYGLQNCKKLELNISIDGFGDYNNYVRSGSNFTDIVQSMGFYNKLIDDRKSDTRICVHTAVSIYNANQLDLLDNFVKEYFSRFESSHQVVQFPVFLSIKNTSKEYKTVLREKLKDYPEISSYLNTTGEDMFAHFINFTQQLDNIRAEGMADLNPFLTEFMNTYPNKVSVSDSKVFFLQQLKEIQE